MRPIRENGDITAFFQSERDFIDYGLCPETGDIPQRRAQIEDTKITDQFLSVFTLSGWLSERLTKIIQGDKKEQLQKEIYLSEVLIRKLHDEIVSYAADRDQRLLKSCSDRGTPLFSPKQVENFNQLDSMQLESIRTKKAITHGSFLSVEKKREHFDREKLLQKEIERFRSQIESIPDRTEVTEIKSICDKITDRGNSIIEQEYISEKLKTELEDIEKKQQEISPLEIESRIRKEIEYIRDLIKLSARTSPYRKLPNTTCR